MHRTTANRAELFIQLVRKSFKDIRHAEVCQTKENEDILALVGSRSAGFYRAPLGRLQGTPALGLLAVPIFGSRLYVSPPLMDALSTD